MFGFFFYLIYFAYVTSPLYVVDDASFNPNPRPIIISAIVITKYELAKPNKIHANIVGIAANIIDLFRPIASLIIQPTKDANG